MSVSMLDKKLGLLHANDDGSGPKATNRIEDGNELSWLRISNLGEGRDTGRISRVAIRIQGPALGALDLRCA